MDPDDIIYALREGAKWAEPAMVTVAAPALIGYVNLVAPDLQPADRERAVEAAVRRGVAKIDKFDRRRGTFAGWLRPFVRNAVNDIRREQGGKVLPLPDDIVEAPLAPEDPRAMAEAEAMRMALASLSDVDRIIITLRDYEHLDYDSCADRIGGVSASACRVRHHRALKRLTEAAREQVDLAHYFEEEVGQ